MADAFKFDVFWSHNAKDQARVRLLAERLGAATFRARRSGPKRAPEGRFDECLIRSGNGPSPAEEKRVAAGRVKDRERVIKHSRITERKQ